jgi:hypothetical protein
MRFGPGGPHEVEISENHKPAFAGIGSRSARPWRGAHMIALGGANSIGIERIESKDTEVHLIRQGASTGGSLT